MVSEAASKAPAGKDLAADQAPRKVTLRAIVVDPFDGTARLLADAQRFGLSLCGLHVETLDRGTAAISMTVTLPSETDEEVLRLRFARHRTVVVLETD